MTDAEVMTTEFVAMLFFKGNFCLASRYLHECNYIQFRLRKIRFGLGETWKKLDEKTVYLIDSYPIAVCDNHLTKRSESTMEKTSRLRWLKSLVV